MVDKELDANRRNVKSLCDHEYYGPLINSYIKCILKSGLLLDEDLEVLLSISRFRHFPDRTSYKPSLTLLASLISIMGTSFLAKKWEMPLLLIPSAVVSLYFSVVEYRNEKRKEDNRKIINNLLEIASKIQKLNKNVIRYMNTRQDVGKARDPKMLLLCGENVEEFMKLFLHNHSHLLHFLIKILKHFTKYSSDLQEDFVVLDHLYSSYVSGGEILNAMENCVMYTQKIYDINVLLFSKLFMYVGILVNSPQLNEYDIRILINETLPKIVKALKQHHDVIKKYFISLRHATNKKSEIKSQSQISKRKNISAKLENTLISSINNLSVILEKSQGVLEKLEEGNEQNLALIGKEILDLRSHTFATYESLDLLCRLYGILSNYNNRESKETINKVPKEDSISTDTIPTVNYNDACEPAEEKFELYVGSEEFSDEGPITEYGGQSDMYLSLMLQELKQSLKTHERFIEAKNKRGDEDDEETDIEKVASKAEQNKSTLKFNLEPLKYTSSETDELEGSDIVYKERKTESLPNLPAPPPPPLPSFQIDNLEGESGQINARSMLENIKILSDQREAIEEVFGDYGADSDSSG